MGLELVTPRSRVSSTLPTEPARRPEVRAFKIISPPPLPKRQKTLYTSCFYQKKKKKKVLSSPPLRLMMTLIDLAEETGIWPWGSTNSCNRASLTLEQMTCFLSKETQLPYGKKGQVKYHGAMLLPRWVRFTDSCGGGQLYMQILKSLREIIEQMIDLLTPWGLRSNTLHQRNGYLVNQQFRTEAGDGEKVWL